LTDFIEGHTNPLNQAETRKNDFIERFSDEAVHNICPSIGH